MREYSLQIPMVSRRTDKNSLTGVTECRNLIPKDKYYVVPDAVTFPWATSTFPWPQLSRLSGYTFYGTPTSLYSVNETTKAITLLRSVSSGSIWQFADFGPAWVAGNGVSCVYRINSSLGYVTGTCTLGKALCDHYRSRLLYSMANSVRVSTVGGDDLPYILTGATVPEYIRTRNDSGWLVMPFRGDVLAMRQMGKHIIVYGADGVSVLSAWDQYYQQNDIVGFPASVGLAWRGAVAGDDNGHVFIGTDGAVWQITPDLKAQRVVNEGIIQDTAVVVLDPRDGNYWLTDSNQSCHISEYGLGGPIEQAIYSMALISGEAVATGVPYTDDIKVEWWGNLMDFGSPDQKRITFLRISTDDMTGIKGSVRFKHNNKSSLTRIPWISADSFGAAKVNTCLHKGYLGIYGTAAPGSRLYRAECRFQLHDKRSIRGTRSGVSTGESDG